MRAQHPQHDKNIMKINSAYFSCIKFQKQISGFPKYSKIPQPGIYLQINMINGNQTRYLRHFLPSNGRVLASVWLTAITLTAWKQGHTPGIVSHLQGKETFARLACHPLAFNMMYILYELQFVDFGQFWSKQEGGGDETGMNEVNHPELIPYWNNLSCLKIRGCVNAT